MSTILKPIVELLHWVLMWIHDTLSSIGLSEHWTWGLAIIGITVIVRTLMFPLTWKQYKSSRAMQALSPHIKELQRKYKDDRQLLQKETMRLYSEHKVNPFASCLPLIIQMPVFFALYYTIRGTDYLPQAQTDALFNASFLWLPKLGEPDPYYILLVVYVASQLISTLLMLTPQTEGMQKWMMIGMPLIFVFVLFRFPSGLFVYWVTTNLWTVGQQLIIRRAMPIVPLEATAGGGGKGGGGGGKNGKDVQAGKAGKAAPPKKRGRFMEAMMAAQEQAASQREAKRKEAAGDGKAAGAKGSGAKKAAAQGSKPGGKKGGKRPPPGKGAKPKRDAPIIDDDNDAPPPYR